MEDYQRSERHKLSIANATQIAIFANKGLRQERIEEYNKNPKLCEGCGEPIDYDKKNANRFCSSNCSATYNNKRRTQSKETRRKISESIRKYNEQNGKSITKLCMRCEKKVHKSKNTFCSNQCARTYQKEHPEEYVEYRALLSRITKARVANGTHNGWMHRNKFDPSYPEKYFIGVFDDWKTSYVREKKVGPYFIDFAIEDRQIAIEIDGKQHLRPDRMEHDKKKDLLLTNNGWQVIRIRWYNPINDKNRELLYEQIENLKKILLIS